MNKYRFILIIGTFLFLLLSFVSAITGAGYGQSFLILVCFLLVSGIFGIGIYQWGARAFWWECFKPIAAVPIAWGLLHLGIALLLPVPARMAWEMDKGVILGFEVGILVLTYILNLFVPFDEIKTRRLLNFIYFVGVLIAGGMIITGLFGGDWREKLNAKTFALISQTATERRTAAIKNIPVESKIEVLNQQLKELQKEIQNPQRPVEEIIREAEETKKQITDSIIQISPPNQKISPVWLPTAISTLWEKIKPIPDMPRRSLVWMLVLILAGAGIISALTGYRFISRAAWGLTILLLVAILADWLVWGGGWAEIQGWRTTRGGSTRPVSGIYKLPADGTLIPIPIVDNLTKGRFRLTQLGKPGRYIIINQNSSPWEIQEQIISGQIKEGGTRLKSVAGRDLLVQVEILK